MENPLVSIIVPTYNVEEYLVKCLDSINQQTFTDFECIIIVDGATDKSFEIAKDYCESHLKFSVYWQDNAGSGPARNTGLKKAQGNFVMFVDPDDWIEPDLLKCLVEEQQTKDFDLVSARRTKVICTNDGNVIKKYPAVFNGESYSGYSEVRKQFLSMLKLGVVDSPTQKLYKMSIIKQYGIEFPDLRRSQDVVFNYRYYNYIQSVKLIHNGGYNYRVLLKDSSGRSPVDYYKTIVYIYENYKNIYEKWGIEFPDVEFCNFFFNIRLFPNLQRCAQMGWNMSPILENDTIKHIVKNAEKMPCFKRIARKLILFGNIGLLRAYMILIVTLKHSGIVK